MRQTTALMLIGLIHRLENFTVDFEVWGPGETGHDDSDDDDDDVGGIIDMMIGGSEAPTVEVIESLKAAMEALKPIIPIVRQAEDYLDQEIGNDVFMERWINIREAAEMRLEDRAAQEISPEVISFLQSVSTNTKDNHESD